MTLGFTSNARAELKSKELKERLLECLKGEKSGFTETANAYYEQSQHDEKTCLHYTQEIITMVDRLLAAGDWDESLFLRNTIKPLKKIREEAVELQQQLLGEQTAEIMTPDLAEDMLHVYISIYQSEGHNLHKWEMQLRSIDRYMLGRPIYQNEEDVQQMVRHKLVQTAEGYVVIAVQASLIQDHGYQPQRKDRNGKPLVTLLEGAVKSDNIVEFVHQGQHYHFINGKLIAKN